MHDDDFFWVFGNYETADVPGWYISKNFGSTCKSCSLPGQPIFLHCSALMSFLLSHFAAIEALQANYYNPNEAAIRTVLWYHNRDCHKLLGYVPSFRYTAPRWSRVPNFLRAPSLPPDPTLPDVPFIRLTEEEKMAKRSRIKNLITATSAELPSVPPRTSIAGQSSETVIALASTTSTQASKEGRRVGKRPRAADPTTELVAELSTEQPAEGSEPTPPWHPQLKHQGKEIPANASVKGDK
ncbi:unnamed protein product [Camellia sinensis]